MSLASLPVELKLRILARISAEDVFNFSQVSRHAQALAVSALSEVRRIIIREDSPDSICCERCYKLKDCSEEINRYRGRCLEVYERYDVPLRLCDCAKNAYLYINYMPGKASMVCLDFIIAFMVHPDLESIEATHIVADDTMLRTMVPSASNITSLSFRESNIPPASMKRLLAPIRALRKFAYDWSTDIPDLTDILLQYCGTTLENLSLRPSWSGFSHERSSSRLGSLRGFSTLKTLESSFYVAAGSDENLNSSFSDMFPPSMERISVTADNWHCYGDLDYSDKDHFWNDLQQCSMPEYGVFPNTSVLLWDHRFTPFAALGAGGGEGR